MQITGNNRIRQRTTQRNNLVNENAQNHKRAAWSTPHHIALLRKISPNYEIYTFRRKSLRLPANGQRTRSNAKTARKYGLP